MPAIASTPTITPVDDWEFDVLDIVNPRKPGKFGSYFDFIRSHHQRLPGDVCEIGVFRGRSLLATAILLRELGSRKLVWGFDSFAGFPAYHANDDLAMFDRLHADGRIGAEHRDAVRRNVEYRSLTLGRAPTASTVSSSGDFAAADLGTLQRKIELLGLENVRLVKGPFDQTMGEQAAPEPATLFAALMDCDLYESHRTALPYVWRRLALGGLVYLDEYYSLKFPGARIAIDEFFHMRQEKPVKHEHHPGEFERWSVRKLVEGEGDRESFVLGWQACLDHRRKRIRRPLDSARLADTTAKVDVLDLEAPPRGLPHAAFHRTSLLNPDAVFTLLSRVHPELILHLAGQAGVKACHDDPAAAFQANITATMNLLEAVRRVRAANPVALPVRALVATSSNHVYGEQPTGATGETAPLAGLGTYAATKACADILCRAYAHEYALPVSVARITNSYGGDDPHTSHIVTSAVLAALRGEAPVIKRSGRDTKAFLYIEDTADALLTLAEHTARRPEVGGCAFNVVPPKSVSVADLVREVLQAVGATHLQPRILDPTARFEHEHLSDRAMREVIGWTPRHTLAQGLAKTAEWYRSVPVPV